MNRSNFLSTSLLIIWFTAPVSPALANTPPAQKQQPKGHSDTATTTGTTIPPLAPTAQTTINPGFKGFADLPEGVQIVSKFSPDKQAATIIFRNLSSQVGGKLGPNANSRTQTVSIPIVNTTKRSLHVTQDIRGFVSFSGPTRTVLVVQAGGVTTVVDLDKARDDPKSDTQQLQSPRLRQAKKDAALQARSQFPSVPSRPDPGDSFNFTKRIEADIPAGADYQITCFLLVERDVAVENSGGVVTIDSLDVEIATMPPTTPKK